MKFLNNPKTTISADGKTATVVFNIEEKEFNKYPMQRNTVGHVNPANLAHARHLQIDENGFYVKAFGQIVAICSDALVSIASVVNPKTSFAPKFKKQIDQSFTVDVATELDPDYQWQVSENAIPMAEKPHTAPPAAVWSDIEGQSGKSLDKAKVKPGEWVRCIASSAAGSMTSNPVKVL